MPLPYNGMQLLYSLKLDVWQASRPCDVQPVTWHISFAKALTWQQLPNIDLSCFSTELEQNGENELNVHLGSTQKDNI